MHGPIHIKLLYESVEWIHAIREREYVNEILGSVKSEKIPDKLSDD